MGEDRQFIPVPHFPFINISQKVKGKWSVCCLVPLLVLLQGSCARLLWTNAGWAVPVTLPLALALGIGDFFTLIHISFCDVKKNTDPLQSQRSRVIFQL